jgi:hypothetical protein
MPPRRRATDITELRIVGTGDGRTLTDEDVLELKRLAMLSRVARLMMFALIALGSLFGLDKLLTVLGKLPWK